MSSYYDIKQSLSYHFVLPASDRKGVLSAALTTAIHFTRCVYCAIFVSLSLPTDGPSTIQLNLFTMAAFSALRPDKIQMTP